MAFRICTIGCGSMATNGHGPSYARYAAAHPETELVACCDLNPEKAERFRERFGFARCYADMDAMLDTEKPDAVCLVAPVELTCELSCRILERGYPLLMEKPPGLTTDEIDQMLAAAKDTPTLVAFNRRYTPLLCELKRQLIEDFPPSQGQHIRYDMTRVGRADPDFSTTAIHGIDATRFLVGSDYAHIRFHYQELPRFGETVVNIFMDCVFASGATGHLNFCPVSGEVVERATVYADAHTFALHLPIPGSLDIPGRLRHIEKNTLRQDIHGEEAEMFVANGFYRENADFFEAIRSGKRPVGDLQSARQSVEVAQAIRERRSEYAP